LRVAAGSYCKKKTQNRQLIACVRMRVVDGSIRQWLKHRWWNRRKRANHPRCDATTDPR